MTRVSGEWLSATGTQTVLSLLEDAGFEAFAVGGCVRNALLGAPVADVDISTNARPTTVLDLAVNAGLKAVPTGIDHGTVTVIANGVGYEVTCYRADVETDGRRAVVSFADTMAEDAIRRDFTMNALYADRMGRVVDPLGGLPDLRARQVRFIEDADRRIREDYLRSLRFFRFAAWYGDDDQGMDADALAAIAGNLDGLDTLSRERVGSELVKLLAAPDPTMAVAVMAQTGVLARVMPGAVSRPLGPLVYHENSLGLAPDGLRRMAGIGFFDGDSLRLSKAQQKRIELYQSLIMTGEAPEALAYQHGETMALSALALQAASLDAPLGPLDRRALSRAASARFPVKPRDLMPEISGAALGACLKRLEANWIASGFTLDKAALLAMRDEG